MFAPGERTLSMHAGLLPSIVMELLQPAGEGIREEGREPCRYASGCWSNCHCQRSGVRTYRHYSATAV